MNNKMKKERYNKFFDLKDLDKQVQNTNSCIRMQKIKDHLALHPYHLNDINSSIKELLNKRIGRFNLRFDGILCGYKNIKLLSNLGIIGDDSCFIHIDIEAEFFIFKPTPQKRLHGIVNKKSTDHIGCLVHKIFNISLPKPKHVDDWIGESLDLNDEVELEITYTNFDGKLPYIRGEIISVLNNKVDSQQESVGKTGKKHKKAKKTVFHSDDETSTKEIIDNENQNDEQDLQKSLGDDETENGPKPKKRKKKKE